MPVLVLVIMLASSNEAEPSAGTWIAQGARDALGQDARVLVEPRADLPADKDALALAEGARASVVVEVRWQDSSHHRVHLHMHTTDVPEWLDRDIEFAREDDPADRGRTLGLAIGAMVTQSTAPSDNSVSSEGQGTAPENKPAPAGPSPAPIAAVSAAIPEIRHPFALTIEGTVGVSGGGDGAIFGGAFLTGWSPSPRLQVHVEGLARTTSLGSTGVRAVTLGAGAGIVWYALVARNVALGPRIDILALHDDVQVDGAPSAQTRTRWVPASDLTMQGEWRLSSYFAVSLALGAEVALGTARVFVGDQRIASLSPFRPMATLGLTLRF